MHSGAASRGYTIIEVIIAMFIFGCITSSIFTMIMNTDRLRGRALYDERVARLAADEAERLRNCAALGGEIGDSSYETTAGGSTFFVERDVMEPTEIIIPRYPRMPQAIELRVSEMKREGSPPHRFRIYAGDDNP